MKRNFKVGDRVRIRQWDDMVKEFGLTSGGDIPCHRTFVTGMRHYCGRTATIRDIDVKNVILRFDDGTSGAWSYSTDMIEPLKGETIVIYRKGDEIIALDKSTGKKAIAKCSPSDTFDFMTGANLALERLKSDGTFQILCVKNCPRGLIKRGTIYTFKNGVARLEKFSTSRYQDFDNFILRNKIFSDLVVELKDGDDPEEILKKYETIGVGDKVKVTDPGRTYSTYMDWVERYVPNKRHRYMWDYDNVPIEKDDIGHVLYIGDHERGDGTLAYVKIEDRCYIINVNGLERL